MTRMVRSFSVVGSLEMCREVMEVREKRLRVRGRSRGQAPCKGPDLESDHIANQKGVPKYCLR